MTSGCGRAINSLGGFMDDLTKTIGLRIKEKREARGLSQKELAEKIGVTPSAINQYESSAKRPSTEYLAKIALELSTETDYLLGITNKDDEVVVAFRELKNLSAKDRQIIMENIKSLNKLSKGKK